jgi:hypothetical protein
MCRPPSLVCGAMRNRNPRRAYNKHGVEQPPMWLGSMRSLGCRKVLVECVACRRMASVNVDRLPDEVPVHDVARLNRGCLSWSMLPPGLKTRHQGGWTERPLDSWTASKLCRVTPRWSGLLGAPTLLCRRFYDRIGLSWPSAPHLSEARGLC